MDVARFVALVEAGVLRLLSLNFSRYAAAAPATCFSTWSSLRRSSSRRISGGTSSLSSIAWPSSLLPSVASDPAIGVRSLPPRSGDGLEGRWFELLVFVSNRRKASPNRPASSDLVPDKEIDGILARLVCLEPPLKRLSLFFEGSSSSIALRKSTLELILVASVPNPESSTKADGNCPGS